MTGITFAVDGPVATITMDRPEVRNAVDRPMAAALRDASWPRRPTRRSA